MPKQCDCPIYCRYCGARLRRDPIGHYCSTQNCQWQHGVNTCPVSKREPRRAGRKKG